MKHAYVSEVLSPNEVRDSLKELEADMKQSIDEALNWDMKNGNEMRERASIKIDDLNFWTTECRRLLSFFT